MWAARFPLGPRRVPIAHGIPAISTQRPNPSEKLIPSDI